MKWEKNISDLNKGYFESLAVTRATLNNPAIYLATIFIGFVLVIPYWLIPTDYGLNSFTNPIVLTLMISNIITVMILMLLLSQKSIRCCTIISVFQVSGKYCVHLA